MPTSAPVEIDPSRRLVLIPIGRCDLRAAAALDYAASIPAIEHHAVHVASDERALWELADAWMANPSAPPLETIEDAGGLGPTISRLVEHQLDRGYLEVIVVLGRLALRRRWHRLLHDRSAELIAAAVDAIPGGVTAVLTVAST